MFRTTAILIAMSISALLVWIPLEARAQGETRVVTAGMPRPVPSIALDVSAPTEVPLPAPESSGVIEAPSSTPHQDELVEWARGRFAQAGLELPDVIVRFDSTREMCRNAEGRYEYDGSDHLVTICTRDSDNFAAEVDRKRTLLHELGHAWDTVNLSDDDRVLLADRLGADHWYEGGAWADRGVERFAETFVFSLLDQSARHLKFSAECSVLVDVFETATGAVPQGPGEPTCGP